MASQRPSIASSIANASAPSSMVPSAAGRRQSPTDLDGFARMLAMIRGRSRGILGVLLTHSLDQRLLALDGSSSRGRSRSRPRPSNADRSSSANPRTGAIYQPRRPLGPLEARPKICRARLRKALGTLDDRVDDRRISERRGVAELVGLALGDLAKDPSHALARASLGQAGDQLQAIDASVG